MIVLHFSMQGEDIFERNNGKCRVFTHILVCQKEEVNLEHTNAKCHLCTLSLTCRPLCNKGMHLHNTSKHTHAKILASALDRQVS